MKRLITAALLLAASSAAGLTMAQEATLPEKLDGFFRLTNSAFDDALTIKGRYDICGTVPDPANAGSVFEISTTEMWNFALEIAKYQTMLEQGLITEEEYTQIFMSLMNQSWKSGFYPLTKFRSQGVDYIGMIDKLPDYADSAIEYFLNNDIQKLYTDYREQLTLLCVFAADIINPTNLETEETFRQWAENYLTKWRSATDFTLFLHPVYDIPDDTSSPSVPTGEYYLEFKTPPYVGNMEKAQKYINGILTNNDPTADVDTLNLWGSAKHYILQEIARDYPEGSKAYDFVHNLLGDTNMNQLYVIGESEEGGIQLQPLPDAFNTQGIILTDEDVARCTWKFDVVDDSQPFAVRPDSGITDGEGNFYTTLCTDFAYRMLSSDTKAFYATSVDTSTGVPELTAVAGDVVPAATPVVIKSTSSDVSANRLLPIQDETAAPIDGNALYGTCLAFENDGHLMSLGSKEGTPAFIIYHPEVPANSAYAYSETGSISTPATDSLNNGRIYDILGREVKDAGAKGIYIINGKKTVRF